MGKLQGLLEMQDIRCQSYSGRGMMGKSCLGVVVADLKDLFMAILEGTEGEEDTTEIQRTFENMRTDSMGRDMICYFPGTEFSSDGEGDVDDDHSDDECDDPSCCTPGSNNELEIA